ncbi:MAG: alkaline phosphatase [Bacteroidales bacterium]|jgi:alkaline phosphatase|nr:alkaline phosphatase [Bacteroidales bacterium]
MRKNIIFFIILIILCFNSFGQQSENNSKPPKYVFLFIGDGMGFNHISLTEAFLSETIGFKHLAMTNFPVFGQCETFCKNSLITDSGAAGSAIACGAKENFENISYYQNSDTIKSLAKIFHKKGYKIGIITSTDMNDATPATFYASNKSRKNYYNIALEAPKSDFELFAGGTFYQPTDKNKDKINILNIFTEKNYFQTNNIEDLSSEKYNKILFTNKTTLEGGEMPYCIDNNIFEKYSLSQIVESSIKFLDNKNGFFIMTEGGKIDWACHENDAATAIQEVIDFDNAIKTAYDFYLKHPDETLIIVTADHETGGLSLGIAQNKYNSDFSILKNQKISHEQFANKFEEYKNSNPKMSINDIIAFVNKEFYYTPILFTDNELQEIQFAYDIFFKNDKMITTEKKYKLFGNYNPLTITFMKILTDRASVGFTTWAHTAAKVPLFAIGKNSQIFSGTINNSDITPKILGLFE